MTMKAPLRQSPLHNVSRKLGATIAAFQGWQVPTTFSNAQAELEVLKTGVGLADVSWLGKLELKGPEEELQAFGVPEGEVWHLARGHLLITCDPGQEVAISEAIAHHIAQIEAANAGNALDSHDESAGDNSNVRPEPVEGSSVHGSTSSPRTDTWAGELNLPGSDTGDRVECAMPPPGRRNLRLHRIAACRAPQPRGLAETDSARHIRHRTSKRLLHQRQSSGNPHESIAT